MKFIFTVLFFILANISANATCSDSYYNSTRANRINAIIGSALPHGAYLIGDSFPERASIAYNQASLTYDAKPLYILGSAGATIATLKDCFPNTSLNNPDRIIIQIGLNDANNGTCCTGSGPSTSGAPFASDLDAFLTSLRNAQPNATIILVSDLPPESVAAIDTYRVFQTARVMYYEANKIIGTQPNTFAYVDNYYLLGTSCTPSSLAYSTPCYQASGYTLDNIHPSYINNKAMLDNILRGH